MDAGAGCEQCTDADAAIAWERSRGFGFVARIVDESHFFGSVQRCPSCSKNYALIFCETIDWDNSGDPQYKLLIPLTATEAQSLAEAGEEAAEAALRHLSPRDYLLMERGSGAKDWSMNSLRGQIIVPPHD
jgi:hypothetical protein